MIMPTKYIKEKEALIGVGALLLQHIDSETNISILWESVKTNTTIGTYERFILALDLLFILGLINNSKNKIFRVQK